MLGFMGSIHIYVFLRVTLRVTTCWKEFLEGLARVTLTATARVLAALNPWSFGWVATRFVCFVLTL